MADYLSLLFSKAFEVVPGPRYNEASRQLRESRNLFFYEVILPPDAPWEFLGERIYPSLTRFLKGKSLDPERGEGVVVSLFWEDRFYLLAAADFLKAYAEIEGLDPEAFRSRMLGWLSEPGAEEDTEKADGFRPGLPAIRR